MIRAASKISPAMVRELINNWDLVVSRVEDEYVLASGDTLPKGQDAKQGLAGTESGAVPHVDAADAQPSQPNE